MGNRKDPAVENQFDFVATIGGKFGQGGLHHRHPGLAGMDDQKDPVHLGRKEHGLGKEVDRRSINYHQGI